MPAPPIANTSIAKIVNITCKRGDTFDQIFLRYWQDSLRTVPLDITASTFVLNVIDSYATKNIILTFTMSGGLSITAPNILNIDKTAVQMNVPAGNYFYELKKVLSDTVTANTIQKGVFTIEDNTTP